MNIYLTLCVFFVAIATASSFTYTDRLIGGIGQKKNRYYDNKQELLLHCACPEGYECRVEHAEAVCVPAIGAPIRGTISNVAVGRSQLIASPAVVNLDPRATSSANHMTGSSCTTWPCNSDKSFASMSSVYDLDTTRQSPPRGGAKTSSLSGVIGRNSLSSRQSSTASLAPVNTFSDVIGRSSGPSRQITSPIWGPQDRAFSNVADRSSASNRQSQQWAGVQNARVNGGRSQFTSSRSPRVSSICRMFSVPQICYRQFLSMSPAFKWTYNRYSGHCEPITVRQACSHLLGRRFNLFDTQDGCEVFCFMLL